jgi:rhamnogalacturonan endolyase
MALPRQIAATILAVVTTSAGIVLATRADAAAGCAVTYTVSNTWPGGFGAAVDVTNLGDAINGWTLTFALPGGQTISQLWNGVVTQTGANVSVKDAGYNAALATNATAGFGFNSSGTAVTPSSFSLNGTVCTGGVAPTSSPSASPSTSPSASPSTSPEPSGPPPATGPVTVNGKQLERLDRGVVSVRSGGGNLVSWRLLGNDPNGVAFNVYRGTTKVNSSPITTSTNYLDTGAAAGQAYTVRAVVNGAEQAADGSAGLSLAGGYLDVPIQAPGGGTTPSGEAYTYVANDASVGDLDGDGQYEVVLKWDPTNAKDNSQSGYTGNVFVDAYRLNGVRLWRIDLGRNIRAGAHYTQFQVFDYDGDGRAEVAMKTADGSRSGTGVTIGSATADHRNSSGYVLAGPEYLTVFSGQTGAALSTVNYNPARGTVSSWGDSYGNRVDRFLAGTAYLDGARPSLIMARGYYTRAVVAAWDFRNGTLTQRWVFDSNASGNSGWAGQGNHQLSVADVDGDGRHEIIYGAAAIDDNGARLWNTNNGHGDAMHVGDLDPSRAGLEEFKVDEDASKPSSWMADARTGQIIWSTPASGDNGRGVSADIWSGSAGAESWSSAVDGVRNPKGAVVSSRKPGSANFVIWWDGDATRELLDQTRIDKYGTSADTRLLTAGDVHSNNGTKATPSLSADLFGDWREEVIWPTTNNTALRVYSTPIPTDRKVVSLMHDPQYREAIAWQNTAYNQPPHPSFAIQ